LTGKTYRIAVNQRFVELKDTMVSSGDEIAFMPPFSGG
jgi:molybdopterin converting factor small subunit